MPASRQIFVNLPVRDLARSVEFFGKLGYRFDPRFTDENATCMILGENLFAMLLVEKRFRDFTPKPIADAREDPDGHIWEYLWMDPAALAGGAG